MLPTQFPTFYEIEIKLLQAEMKWRSTSKLFEDLDASLLPIYKLQRIHINESFTKDSYNSSLYWNYKGFI